MYKENTLYDIYQTIISFGNYIQIQYLSKQVQFSFDFGDNYEIDFQLSQDNNELTIDSTESSYMFTISECNKIDLITNNNICMSFKIELRDDTYILIIVEK